MSTENKNSAARIQANNRYNAKAYDRINITVPKGHKQTVEAAAASVGESVNLYTQRALLARMGLEEWPAPPEEQRNDQPEND